MRPPSDPGAAGHAELQGVGSGDERPDSAVLAARPWLTQGASARGTELETVGLSVNAGHPELQLLNLPTMFVEMGVRLLRELGTYVLAGGTLVDGDVMQMRADLPCLVGFFAPPDAPELVRVVLLA